MELEIVYMPTSDLVAYEKNPRKNDAVVDRMVESIKEFGFSIPILAKTDKTVVDGHLRLKAALKLNMETVPVIFRDDWSEEQVRAFRLMANQSANWAEWDKDLLALELEQLKSKDFNMALTGFDPAQLEMFARQPFEADAEEETPELNPLVITEPGNVWRLGNHILLCGDSTKAKQFDSAFLLKEVNLMVTDPPYGVEYDANWRNEADRANGKRIGARALGKVANDKTVDWSRAFEFFSGSITYVWHAGRHAATVQGSLESCGFTIRSQIIWAKNQLVISRGDYHWKHEPCWYAVRGKGRWTGDRKQTTLWEIDKPKKSETGHSTQKPVDCMRIPILNHTEPGEVVYDPFVGSGTTIIAAETVGRTCYAVELEPAYVDVAVQRWQNFTGKDAVLEATGKTFNQVREARG